MNKCRSFEERIRIAYRRPPEALKFRAKLSDHQSFKIRLKTIAWFKQLNEASRSRSRIETIVWTGKGGSQAISFIDLPTKLGFRRIS